MADVVEQMTGLFPIVVTAGAVKNLSESILGSTERRSPRLRKSKKGATRKKLSNKYGPW